MVDAISTMAPIPWRDFIMLHLPHGIELRDVQFQQLLGGGPQSKPHHQLE
jgi:hypothetical protein